MNQLQFDAKLETGAIHVNFNEISVMLEDKMKEFKGAVFTEDSKDIAKGEIASLRKLRKSIDDRRKEVKTAYLQPYNDFETQVKRLLSLVDEPITLIDGQLKQFEEKRITEKRKTVQEVYTQLIGEYGDYIPLSGIYGAKWDNASATMKTIRDEIEQVVTKVSSELSVIKSMQSDALPAALELYKKNRNLADAIGYINNYELQKSEIVRKEEERRKQDAEKAQERERDRIRQEERQRVQEEEKIRTAAKAEAVEELKTVDEAEAAPLSTAESKKVIYTVVATDNELLEIEMALTSLGVYFERKDV